MPKFAAFSIGRVVTVTIMAAIGFMAIAYVAKKWPKVPVVGRVARDLHLA